MSPDWTKRAAMHVLTKKTTSMGRSVSTLRGSNVNIYADATHITESYEWDDAVLNMTSEIASKYPSMDECRTWEGEDLIFIKNKLVEISISEYCGCVAVCIRAIEGANFGERFAYQIEKQIRSIVSDVFGGTMRLVGSFSNGEAVYSRN